MHNSIDKDVHLFFPQKSKYILFGGNFLFSKRLYEIVKRHLEIKRVDYRYKSTQDSINYSPKIYLDTFERIKGLLNYYNSDTLIFTSEILLMLSKEDFLVFKNLLKLIKKQLNVKIIFISITAPLFVHEKETNVNVLSNMSNKRWYHTCLLEIKKILDSKKDLIYEFSSYYTYVNSNLQTNPLEIIHNNISFCAKENLNNFSLDLADNIINHFISSLHKTGKTNYATNIQTTLSSFIEECSKPKNKYEYAISQSKCALNLIYRNKPYEIVNDKSVANWRFELGVALKKSIPLSVIKKIDAIVPIPETGKYYAQGLAYSLNKTYLEAFYKKTEVGRSFDIENSEKRKKFIENKLGVVEDLINGKVIGIVDEAIFTGTTLKLASELLKNTSVKGIYFLIPSPEFQARCNYNMQPNRASLLENINKNELSAYFEIDGIFFQKENIFKRIIQSSGHSACCFLKN